MVDLNHEVEQIAPTDAACLRLRQIPGIGPLVATAIVASIGNGAAFHKGREFAAWMGLVPKQYSTGGETKLYGISKRGNNYLRKILIYGARAVVLRSKRDRIAMGEWMTALEARAPRNVLTAVHPQEICSMPPLREGQRPPAPRGPPAGWGSPPHRRTPT